MDWIHMLLSRCVGLIRGKTLDADLDEELRAHIDLAILENLKRGMALEEARAAALRAFGGVTQIKERYRSQRGVPFFEVLGQDLRQTGRQLRSAPAFAVTVVAILALGIGANTTVFSIVDAVMLRPLPYAQSERLVELTSIDSRNPVGRAVSYPDFFDWRKRARQFREPGFLSRHVLHPDRSNARRASGRRGCFLGPVAHARCPSGTRPIIHRR